MTRIKYSLILSLLFIGLAYSVDDIIVKNNRLYVNCEEFFIKSFCYSPTPLGRSDPDSNYVGGLCSTRRNVFGQDISACEDEDFFDGSNGDPERNPAGPEGGWFRALWERDFPVMKEAGANTIRIYHASAWTRQASVEQQGTNGIVLPLGKSHREFLDLAEQHEMKVIYPLPGEEVYLRTKTQEEMYQMIRNVVDEVGNHTAIIMWALGNELPLQDPILVPLLNDYMGYARVYTKQRWNRVIPATHAVVDLPFSYDYLAKNLDVDIFSTNAGYRGFGFSDLWDGNAYQNFSGWRNLSLQYNKPVFISEVGWHSLDNAITNEVPNWFNQIYQNLMPHVDDGCIGLAFFEFNDERTKVDDLQKTMGAVAFEENVVDGVSSAEINVWHPDTLVRKPVFESIKSGILDGKPYNLNGDVFALIGRPKDVLTPEQCVPQEPRWTTTSTTGSLTTTGSTGTGSTTGTTGQVSTTGQQSTTGTTGQSISTGTSSNTPASTTGSSTGVDEELNRESSATFVSINMIALVASFFAFFL